MNEPEILSTTHLLDFGPTHANGEKQYHAALKREYELRVNAEQLAADRLAEITRLKYAPAFDRHFSDILPYLQHKRDCAKFRAKDDGPGLRLGFWDDKKPCTCGLAELEEKYGRKP